MIGLNSISYPVDAPDAPDARVVADGWFPPVTLDRVRTLTQLGRDTTETQLTSAIEGAMLTVFRQVVAWRKTHVLAGAADVAAVTDQMLNDRNQAEVLWERAVAHHAHADLSSGDLAMSATDSGMNSTPGRKPPPMKPGGRAMRPSRTCCRSAPTSRCSATVSGCCNHAHRAAKRTALHALPTLRAHPSRSCWPISTRSLHAPVQGRTFAGLWHREVVSGRAR
jgi:hypothetical protein